MSVPKDETTIQPIQVVAERDAPLRSEEPLVRCSRCRHFPCVFCGGLGGLVCDETVEVLLSPEEIERRRASIEVGNGMSANALPAAHARTVPCSAPECTRGWYDGDLDKPSELFYAKDAHARAIVDGSVLWFCSQPCVDAWVGASEFDMCSCDTREGGCIYSDSGREQNERVFDWVHDRIHDDSDESGLSIDDDGFVSVHVTKKSIEDSKETSS